ncbi:MAG: phytanoyl-CoA dioxygenase family protein [Planctomycetota bacterium]
MLLSTAPEAAQAAGALSPEARRRFLTDGCLLWENAVDGADLERLEGIYDRCFDPATPGVRLKPLGGEDAGGRQLLPQVLFPSQTFPELRELALFERFRAAAAEIFQTPVVFRSEHMILKPAGYGVATPWHQDQAYHDPALDYRQINFWVPLQDATVESGCMQFVPGSHRGPVLPHEYLREGRDDTALVAQDQGYWSANGVALPCPRGGCTLHHSTMLHYAGPNTTGRARRAYILVFGVEPTRRARPWTFPWRE